MRFRWDDGLKLSSEMMSTRTIVVLKGWWEACYRFVGRVFFANHEPFACLLDVCEESMICDGHPLEEDRERAEASKRCRAEGFGVLLLQRKDGHALKVIGKVPSRIQFSRKRARHDASGVF